MAAIRKLEVAYRDYCYYKKVEEIGWSTISDAATGTCGYLFVTLERQSTADCRYTGDDCQPQQKPQQVPVVDAAESLGKMYFHALENGQPVRLIIQGWQASIKST